MNRLQRQLIEAIRRSLATGKGVVVPEAGRLLWRWFGEISAARSYHMSGPNPISYSEIDTWQRVTGRPIEPRHVEVLLAMDRAYLEHVAAKRTKAPNGMKEAPPVSKHEMSLQMFDAMFS